MPISIAKQLESAQTEEQQIRTRINRYRKDLYDDTTSSEEYKEYLESSIKSQEKKLKENESKQAKLRGENRKSALLGVIFTLLILIVLHYLGYIDLMLLIPTKQLVNNNAAITEEERRQQIRELMIQQKEEEAAMLNKQYMM